MTFSLMGAIVSACNKEHNTTLTTSDITDIVLGTSYIMVNGYDVSWESIRFNQQ